jgi:hypothetical protein
VSATINSVTITQTATVTVSPAGTATTITSHTPNPSVVGQEIGVAYTVTSSAGNPTGDVTVSDGAGDTCNGTVTGGGCTLTPATAGTKTLTATYAGDAGFAGSVSSGVGHTVNAASTMTAITSQSANPSTVGQAVSFTFTVATNAPGSGTPTGNVTVSDGTQSCNATVAVGSCSIAFSSTGSRTVTAVYAGDGNFATSTSAGVTQTVTPASTTTTITGHTPDPSVLGQGVVVSFTVTSAAGTPTGSVTVTDGTGDTCSGTVTTGTCTLTPLTPGSKSLVASYAGDGTFAPSASAPVAHTVNLSGTPSSSRSSMSASPNPITASDGANGSTSTSLSAINDANISTITVTVRDGFGNPVSGATVTLGATPSTGIVLTQPVGTTDVNGQITGTLASTKAAVKTVSATVNGSIPLNQTVPVTVDPATATHLTFTRQPSAVVLGSAISPPVVVTAWDAFENQATGFSDNVTMAIGNDASLFNNATLGGTNPVAAVAGVATFTDLTISQLGLEYTIVATASGLSGATSNSFSVVTLLP